MGFGRGGFAEKRRVKMEDDVILQRLLNLSTRRHQGYIFNCFAYNLKSRAAERRATYLKTCLPPRSRPSSSTAAPNNSTDGSA